MTLTITDAFKLGEGIYEELEMRDLDENEKAFVLGIALQQLDKEKCTMGWFDQ